MWSNVWLGVSIENQATADECIPLLLKTPAAVRWVSAEPLLAEVDLYPYLGYRAILCGCGFNHDETNLLNANDEEKCTECGYKTKSLPTLDWIVAGGETGINARPTHPDWLKTLRLHCQVTGTKFLFKQWGEWGPVPTGHGNTNPESKTLFLRRDGTTAGEAGCETFNVCAMQRLGKRANGRLLDGVLHDSYPHDVQEGADAINHTGWTK